MEISEVEEEYEHLKKFQIFDHEKVDFPASKLISEWFMYLPKVFQSVKQCPKILLDTHKIHFRRLEVIVSSKSGNHENQ